MPEKEPETIHPKRPLVVEEIAWAVIGYKKEVELALMESGFEIPENDAEERLVRIIYDNQNNVKLNDAILRILSQNPYQRSCWHCFEAVEPVVKKASRIC